MSLHIYNTLTRRKELFQPLNPPKVGMYVCGVTVYDYCHLGHARALINFDVIYRYLKRKGFQVTYVRNYTDVDDKIIKRAQEEGIAWNEVSEKYIRAFDEDMDGLKLERPTFQPRATENIGEIVKIVESLVEKGFAYKAGSDIFYSVRKKSDYGKLSGKKIDELESGARVEIHEAKNDPLDFSLWKSSKPGEPLWNSPWGDGRPGWHIECSAMSMKHLGLTFDIHGGGRDLAFPHHENEIAQSEAYSGKPFARYWIHNGFVNINAEKMSKSLGNFMTIREILKSYHPEVVRLFILSAHYRSPLDYTEKNMQDARQSLSRWYTTMSRIREHCGKEKKPKLGGEEAKLGEKVSHLYADFEEAMDDDFNTAQVCGLLFDLMREWNKVLDSSSTICSSICHLFVDTIGQINEVLGVFGSDPETYLSFERGQVLKAAGLAPEEIEKRIQARNEARKNRKWEEADAIRKELTEAGVQLKDNPDGTTTWSVG
ncbi:MAG: cysteine--tRNA ligase [Deltaproteobacteria bacterium]|nr:cysteine--tRNA ligase [Deltaproteobacteria bacterium]